VQCGHRRSIRNWLTLLVLVAASVYIWITKPAPADYALGMVVATYFALIAVIDIEHRLILHPTSIFGAVLGLLVGWRANHIIPTLLGGLIGFLLMLAIYYLGVWFAKYRARRMEQAGQAADDEEALGFGDVNLAGVLGLMVGWLNIGTVLLQGILLAGIFSVFMVLFMFIARKYKENALMIFIPYGPFLIASAFLNIFVPNWIPV
jgi:leader peptidase (prepilin peptidase)/N-methyltransferase